MQCSIPTVNSLVEVSMVNADGMAEPLTLRASCTMAIATVAAITAGQRVCAHPAIITCLYNSAFLVSDACQIGELQLLLSCLKLLETKMAQSVSHDLVRRTMNCKLWGASAAHMT
jgi:hypothetical protein